MDDFPVPVDLADDPPHYYRVALPDNLGTVVARFAGEGDPVRLSLPGAPEIEIPRAAVWGLWVVLLDAIELQDDVPDWAIPTVEPTDEHGRPLPVPIP
ncbi:hypothetical protein ACFYOK_29595 [Microbispora bryophytorum]|uniref:hypothetical protein n=1 Tax=Microbispora bryophytorum TaxID=1460882 RepID=UPI00340F73C0